MKVILTIGSPHSGYEAVAEILGRAGVTQALPSTKANLTPQALQEQLLHSHELDLSKALTLEQVRPGKFWNELATDLFLSNMQHNQWGWADHQTAVLMDFWRDFDTQTRLLLVYSSPADYLGRVLRHNPHPTANAITAALDAWARWNTALLRYLHRHSDCCVMVNSQQAIARPQALVAALSNQWQLKGLLAVEAQDTQEPTYLHLQGHLINRLIDQQHPAINLYQELQGAAGLPSPEANDITVGSLGDPYGAWADWSNVNSRLAELAIANTTLAENCNQGSALITEVSQTEHLKLELANTLAQRDTLAQENLALAKASAEATSQNDWLKQESENLLLELHGVQQELEEYFSLYQQSKASDFWLRHCPQEITVAMDQEIIGSNWYPAEADSRWAGPDTLSTLEMPALRAGDYTLELDIVDAMDRAIVNSMVVEAFGKAHPVEVSYPLYQGEFPLVCSVPLHISVGKAPEPWLIGLRFTHLAAPSQGGSNAQRPLAIKLRTLRLVRQS